MKKITLLISLAFIIQATAFSQSCLPDGITFNTQVEIDNFQSNYPGCTEIEGFVTISGSDITNLNGLNVLTAIWGRLRIYSSAALTNLTGLESITTIGGDLNIAGWPSGNPSLTSLTGLNNLISVGGAINITGNDSLINLTGLENVTTVGGYIQIALNNVLSSLTGLDNVTSVGEYLWIGENIDLTNLTGLGNLTTIGGYIEIYASNLTSLTGLESLTTVGEYIQITYNNALTSLASLENLTLVGGDLNIYDNDALTSLIGLDSIEAGSISDLLISGNSSLSTCDVKSICDYLVSPGGNIDISDNATGCNNTEEVEEACESSSVSSINLESSITIFPNPATDLLYLSGRDETILKEVTIYNQVGQQLLNEKRITNTIDVSMLQQGMYIIELVSNDLRIREKLMIKK